jgi:hypothetical protein
MSRITIRRARGARRRSGFFPLLAAAALALLPPTLIQAEWIVEPVHLAQDAGWKLFLDVDPSGTAYASYYRLGASFPIAQRTVSGWQETQVVPFGLAFALNNAGTPYMLSTPANNYYPSLQAFGGPSPTTPIENVRASENAFLGFDSQNQPRAAYIDPFTQRLRAATWDGSNWHVQTVATNASFQFGNSYAATTLDAHDNLQFVFPSGPGLFDMPLSYARQVGGVWTTTPTGLDGYVFDLRVDPAGNPNFLLDHETQPGIYIAHFNGASWTSQLVPGTGSISNFDGTLEFDSQGNPHIFAHVGNGTEFLVHYYETSGIWHNETVASWTDHSDGSENVTAQIDGQTMRVLFSTGNEQIFYASAPVPEPSTCALSLLALAALCICARRKAQRRIPA